MLSESLNGLRTIYNSIKENKIAKPYDFKKKGLKLMLFF